MRTHCAPARTRVPDLVFEACRGGGERGGGGVGKKERERESGKKNNTE